MGEPIAVVGLGCVLPDALNVRAFWDNTLRGHSAIRELRGGGWEWTRYHDPNPSAPDRAHCILGARVEDWVFDWRRFRMPPAEAESINPLQLMVLDAGTQALEGVKVIPRERAGLFLGGTGLGWQRDSGLRIRMQDLVDALEQSEAYGRLAPAQRQAVLEGAQRSLDARLKPVSEDNVVGASASVAAGRIAMHFDLKGLHYSVDAGFASSLAALECGVRALRDGTLDLSVVGGVSELLSPLELVAFSKMGGLAQQKVAPFDASAEGTLLGEGTVIFALKRLSDAERDGDLIHAVVLGVGGSSDGHGKALVAPRAEGQALAMRRAYDDGEVSPHTVGFVECHATGTQVGDASEVRALARIYAGGARSSVALGSAKPFVGHLRAAAGAVGMLRAVLALQHRTVPAQIAFKTPNPALELDSTPFYVPTANTALTSLGDAELPRAAVSAFGFGGNNFHAVLEAHAGARPRPARRKVSTDEPIAVVGMGGIFPGAEGVDAFWRMIMDGRDTTREVPKDRWDIDRHWSNDPTRLDRSYSRLGCFLEKLPSLEERWRIPPSAAESLDPSHLLVLRCAEEALSDARYTPGRWDKDRVAVMLAFLPYQGKKFLADIRVNFQEYAADLAHALKQAGVSDEQAHAVLAETEVRFKRALPGISEDTLTGYLGSVNAARVTKLHDFHGPHFVVDSACASTHAALHAAVSALRHRTADVVLSGGVWCDMMPEFFIAACRFNALSATGITPFCARADGFIPGEGAGIFVLKRLSDAERDGDKVHAVIRAVAGSSDGRGRSVLAPNPAGEAMAMTRALEAAGVDATSVDYVECHGTGTALGDVVEVDALTRAYGKGRPRPLLIGSVKSNIGHLNAAAGAPALIKTALAVRDGVIPPSLKVETPNPQIDFASGPVSVVTTARQWVMAPGQPRRAGISGFGVGGTNMHLVVEQYLPQGAQKPRAESAVVVTEAAGPQIAVVAGADLQGCVEALGALATEQRDAAPGAFAMALQRTHTTPPRGPDRVRVAIVASTPVELFKRHTLLQSAVRNGHDLALLRQQGICVGMLDPSLKVTVAFPGQGPQYVNMLREAAARFPTLREVLQRVDVAYQRLAGRTLTSAFIVEDASNWQQRDEDIHCAVFAVNCALYELLRAHGLKADSVLGQSAGELSALVAAGVLSLEDGLGAVRERTLSVLALQTADPGQMVALACSAQTAARLMEGLPGYAALAADNAPNACIVSGARAAMTALVERCQQQGVEATVLAVSHAYHSQMIAGARDRYLRLLRTLTFREPQCEIFSTITGGSLAGMRAADWPEHLASQFVLPVALRQAVEAAYASGTRMFVECGPKWPLTTFIGEILEGRPHAALATIHPKVGEVELLQRALAFLHVHGVASLAPAAPTVLTAPPAPTSSLPPMPATGPTISVPPPGDVVALLRSMRTLIDGFLQPLESAAPGRAPSGVEAVQAVQAMREAVQVLERVSTPPLGVSRPPAPASQRPAPSSPPAAPAPVTTGTPAPGPDHAATVLARLKANVIRKTGYPAEMLEDNLDLEADLGIDTVKQVAILGETRAQLGVAADPNFKLRDHNTLRKMAQYLVGRLGGAVAVAPAPAPVAPAPVVAPSPAQGGEREVVRAQVLAHVMRKTGYPAEMLEENLDLEADLGIDTVKQVAILGEVRVQLGLPQDPTFKLRDHNTLAKVVDHFTRRLQAQSRPVPPPAITTPARGTPAPAAARQVRQEALDQVLGTLKANVMRKTGYPPEMLELDLDLEADLGIDTVKQVAILGETRAQLGLATDPNFKLRETNTLRKMGQYLVGRLAGAAPRDRTPARTEIPVVPAPAPAPSAPVVSSEETWNQVHQLVIQQLIRKTGYPAEMLELDLDLEADLGIDTVKQVAIFGEVRAQLKLAQDPNFRLRDHTTLRKIISHFASRLQPATPPPTTTAPSAPPPVAATPAAPEFQRVGEPVHVTSRAPGTAFICGGAELRVVTMARCAQIMMDAVVKGSGGVPVALLGLRSGAPALVEDTGALLLEVQARAESGQVETRLVSASGAVHFVGRVELAAERPQAALNLASPAVRVGVDPRNRARNGVALLQAVGRVDPGSRTPPVVDWAQQLRFDLLAGGMTVPESAGNPAACIAAALDGAGAIASFGWYALTGAFHVPCALESLRFHALPSPGAELRFHVQLAPFAQGAWHAHALILDGEGRVLGELQGLTGVRVGPTAGAVWQGLDVDGTAVAWQRFTQQLSGPVIDGEDH
ncbi:MAG: beta-ketoacyl synthase N-terminal-like domain-containing protein [Myxococcota bacterium]